MFDKLNYLSESDVNQINFMKQMLVPNGLKIVGEL